MYGTPDAARGAYRWLAPEKKADRCVECGQCEEKCPQNIEIIEWLKTAQEVLS
jgi:predicted aldo/keto reductase-like oxidoreductase